ncbi:glycoside hydrolase family 16 protein [Piromyces sp. E2]|nr:glycoside hydrolase family 16 protein [Piromyces sp. E2]|eukprot:OUM63831.1 glycoside hydrolase family 16 protein [Piromyces sp. E2]
MKINYIITFISLIGISAAADCSPGFSSCGEACYDPALYSCDNGVLCPYGMKNCGGACYSPNNYHCINGSLASGTSPEAANTNTNTNTNTNKNTNNVPQNNNNSNKNNNGWNGWNWNNNNNNGWNGWNWNNNNNNNNNNNGWNGWNWNNNNNNNGWNGWNWNNNNNNNNKNNNNDSKPNTNTTPETPATPPNTTPNTPPQNTNTNTSANSNSDIAGYKLVFSDEFEGSSLDRSKWTPEVNCWGGGNNEKQCYVDHPETIFVKDGQLHLKAIYKGSYQLNGNDKCTLNNEDSCSWSQPIISGRINSKSNNLAWKYCKVRVRAQLPAGPFLWPAIWMLPQDDVYGTWAASGEIDIMEARGQDPSKVSHAIHYGGQWPNNIYSDKLVDGIQGQSGFHVYGLDWNEDSLVFTVDEKTTYTVDLNRSFYSGKGDNPYTGNRQPFDQKFHLLFNLAVGGGFFPENQYGAFDPAAHSRQWTRPELIIDYVRVYQKQ